MLIKILGGLIFFVNFSTLAFANPDLDEVSQSTSWKRLIRKNEIESPTFYFTPSAGSNLRDELQENLEQLKSNPNYPCDFPARAHFISEQFALKYKKCEQVEAWKTSVGGETVSLVYVTQYISNPASAFGHTFLLFKKKNMPLNLYPVVANAANMPEEVSDFDYLFKGLTGGFPAKFSADPFYLKIQEYNNIENRDMWIYDLDLSSDQVDQLLNHIWELSVRGNQKYFFLNQNCAVNTFNALAAVKMELQPISTNRVYVSPAETIIQAQPISKSFSYFPSLREKIVRRTKALPSEQLSEFKIALAQKEQIDNTSNIEVAEIILDHFELQKSKQQGELTAEQKELYQKAMFHRADLGIRKEPLKISEPLPPHEGLLPARVALGGGNEDSESYIFGSAAPFYHSILERTPGFLPNSELIFFDLEIRRWREKTQGEISLISMSNFPTVSAIDSQWSWRIGLGFVSQIECDGCWDFQGRVGIGKSYELTNDTLIYFLAGAHQDADISLSPQVSSGILSSLGAGKLLFEGRILQEMVRSSPLYRIDFAYNIPVGRDSNLEVTTEFGEDYQALNAGFDFHF